MPVKVWRHEFLSEWARQYNMKNLYQSKHNVIWSQAHINSKKKTHVEEENVIVFCVIRILYIIL